MEKIIINDYNLEDKDIEVFTNKVRALLVDSDNNFLIGNYGGVYLLPGGKIDDGEEVIDALVRELEEEIGISYNTDELEYFTCLEHYQKDYPLRNGELKNRLIRTYFYVGNYRGVVQGNSKLTEKEKKGNFSLNFVSINDICDFALTNYSSNPRSVFFQRELFSILDLYGSKYCSDKDQKVLKYEK